jgi:glycosyltransferase involved in cell wall biosynthesis
VLGESISLGCPAIAFKCPFGADEIIENGVNGIIVPYQDVDALASAMQRFVLEPQLRDQLIKNIFFSGNRFNKNMIADQWLSVY